MAIYDANGNQLSSVYDASGIELDHAYDAEGNVVYSKGQPTGIRIKAMTFNVGQWYTGTGSNVPAAKKDAYYALHRGMISSNNPDILLLEEYVRSLSGVTSNALEMLQSLFPYVEDIVSGAYYGRAICSKYPISNYVHHSYSTDSNRYYDSWTVTINNIPITVVVTHLSLTQANRDIEIQELISYLKTLDRFICGGDFNTNLTDLTIYKGSPAYNWNVLPFVEEGFNTSNFGEFGFKVTCIDDNETNGYLDNFITSSNISVINILVDTTKATDEIADKIDHMPFIAELLVTES